jgi:hypothetical protein
MAEITDEQILSLVSTVYTDEELRRTYRTLAGMNVNIPRGKIVETDTNIGLCHTGNICSNHFFLKHRLHATCGTKGTIFDWVKRKGLAVWQEKVVKDNKSNKSKPTIAEAIPSDYLSTVSNQVGKVPSQFKPRYASLMCEFFKPTSVLDFSAGWGDRCIGVCAKGVNYIGIDANVDLEPTYREMCDFYGIRPTLLFQPSETVDFSQLNYDMVFTSPPYFTLENYQHMPDYGTYEAWVDKFLRPVVTNSFKHLKSGGWMCLNIPSITVRVKNYPIYETVCGFLGKEHKRIKLNLQSQSDNENVEYIYCWNKDADDNTSVISTTTHSSEVEEEEAQPVEQQIVLDITNKSYSIEVKGGKLIIKIK